MTSQVITLNQSFASYLCLVWQLFPPLLSLEWNAFIWDLGPNIRAYSYIHRNKKLVIHFLSVTWEFLITEWFFAAICYSSIKQIIYSQVIKTTKKQENVSVVRAALCMISSNGEPDPPWKHLYSRSLQDSHTSLLGQAVLHWERGFLWAVGVLQDVRLMGLWLRSSYGSSSAKHLSCIDFASEKHICVLQSPSGWTASGIEHNGTFDLSGGVVSFKHILKKQNSPWTPSLSDNSSALSISTAFHLLCQRTTVGCFSAWEMKKITLSCFCLQPDPNKFHSEDFFCQLSTQSLQL